MLTGEQITLGLAALAGVVWLVRLEGRVNAQGARLMVLETAIKAHEETKIEVVRLQEQIKHLTGLIEKWFEPIDPPAAKRRRQAAQG